MATKKKASTATAAAAPTAKKPRSRRSPEEIIADAEARLAAEKRSAARAHPGFKHVRAAYKALMQVPKSEPDVDRKVEASLDLLSNIAEECGWTF